MLQCIMPQLLGLPPSWTSPGHLCEEASKLDVCLILTEQVFSTYRYLIASAYLIVRHLVLVPRDTFMTIQNTFCYILFLFFLPTYMDSVSPKIF